MLAGALTHRVRSLRSVTPEVAGSSPRGTEESQSLFRDKLRFSGEQLDGIILIPGR